MPSTKSNEVPAQHDHQAQRKKLLAKLRGQTVRIPNMHYLFQNWPTKTNPELERLRVDVREWLDSIFPPSKFLSALHASDFGFFGATWWPCSPFPQLRIVTYLIIWLFVWDDEIDLSSGTLWNEFSASQIYRDETLAYVRYILGIDVECKEITNPIILMFKPIGDALREAYSPAHCRYVYDEMKYFMSASEREQKMRLAGDIPTVEDFWHYRLGSSAVAVCTAVVEYSLEGVNLPVEFYADEDVKTIIRCTNTNISAVNDLVSIKKEIKREAIDSLIPIIYFQTGSIQTAVNEVVKFIAGEIDAQDAAGERLFRKYDSSTPEMQDQVRRWVDGCKHYTTGNFIWSLETGRYGVDHANDGTGDLLMKLPEVEDGKVKGRSALQQMFLFPAYAWGVCFKRIRGLNAKWQSKFFGVLRRLVPAAGKSK